LFSHWRSAPGEMKQQHRSGLAAGLVLAFMAFMVGTVFLCQPANQILVDATGGRAAAAQRSLAATSGFEQGKLPSVVKVSNSQFFDGFYENTGSNKGRDGVRTEFAFNGENRAFLYYENNQWVLSADDKNARCHPPKPAVLPEQGSWRFDDGRLVHINIKGFDGRAGTTFTTDPEKREKLTKALADLHKTSGTKFDLGIDADGKQQNRDDPSSDSTSGSSSNNPKTDQTDSTKDPSAKDPSADSSSNPGAADSTGPDQPDSSNDNPGAADSTGPDQTDSSSSNQGAADSNGPDQTGGGETPSPDQTDSSNDNPDAADSNGPDQTGGGETPVGDQSAGSTTGGNTKSPNANNNATNSYRNSTIDDCDGQNSTTNDCDDQLENRNKRKNTTVYKILLIGLALLSLICACICTAASFLRPGKGKEDLEGRELVPGDSLSDIEDAENKTRRS